MIASDIKPQLENTRLRPSSVVLSMANKDDSALKSDFLLSPAVTVTVGTGNDKKTFYVHECLLKNASQYFKTALQSKFSEAGTKVFRLDEDDPVAFQLFVEYLYNFEGEKRGSRSLISCADAFVLGCKLVAPAFNRKVVEWAAEDMLNRSPLLMKTLLQAVGIICNRTSETDGKSMKKLLVMYCASRLGSPKTKRKPWTKAQRLILVKSRQQEFLADLLGHDLPGKLSGKKRIIKSIFQEK